MSIKVKIKLLIIGKINLQEKVLFLERQKKESDFEKTEDYWQTSPWKNKLTADICFGSTYEPWLPEIETVLQPKIKYVNISCKWCFK